MKYKPFLATCLVIVALTACASSENNREEEATINNQAERIDIENGIVPGEWALS